MDKVPQNNLFQHLQQVKWLKLWINLQRDVEVAL